MDHWYCAHVTAPWGHNINAIDIMIPCPNPKLSQNWTIDIMTSWVIDIVPMLLSQGVTISMPLILWPHVPIWNLAKNWTIDIMATWSIDIVNGGRGHNVNIDITASLAMILCTCWYCGTLPFWLSFWLGHGATISMALVLWPPGPATISMVHGVLISMVRGSQYQWQSVFSRPHLYYAYVHQFLSL